MNENISPNLASKWTGASTRESNMSEWVVLFCTCLLEGLTTIGGTVSQRHFLQTALSLRKNTEMEREWEATRQLISNSLTFLSPRLSTCLFSTFTFLLCLITNKFGEDICILSCLLSPSWIQRTDLSSPIHHVSWFYWFWAGEQTFLPWSPSTSPPPAGIPLVMRNSLPHKAPNYFQTALTVRHGFYSSVGKESACNTGRRPWFDSWVGKIPWEGIGYTLQYSWASPVAQLANNQCGRPGFNLWVGKIPWRRERLPSILVWRIPWAV